MCPHPHPPVPQGLSVRMYPQLQSTMMLRASHEDGSSSGLTRFSTGLPACWTLHSCWSPPTHPAPVKPSTLRRQTLYSPAVSSCLFWSKSSVKLRPDPEAT